MKAVRIVTLIVALLVAPILCFRAYTEYSFAHTLLGMAWGILATLSFIWVYVNRKPGKEYGG